MISYNNSLQGKNESNYDDDINALRKCFLMYYKNNIIHIPVYLDIYSDDG